MVTIKGTLQIGLSLILGLAFVAPAFAQCNENSDWQAIEDQKDKRQQAELLERFVDRCSRSGRRPDADFMLLDFYLQNRDNAKIIAHAEKYRQAPPTADTAAKAKIFTQAMVAAATLQDVKRTVEYSGYALQAEPNNLVVLGFLAGNNLPDPAKALEYATLAVTVPRPATMREEQYATLQARMHNTVANGLFGQSKFAEANEHFAISLKANPKDHVTQFRYGYSLFRLAADSAAAAQTANDELIAIMVATPVNTAAKDAAQAKVDAASKQALANMSEAVEALGKAVAIGGQYASQAKPLLDTLYKSKTGSLDGEDQFIAQKKTELGI